MQEILSKLDLICGIYLGDCKFITNFGILVQQLFIPHK